MNDAVLTCPSRVSQTIAPLRIHVSPFMRSAFLKLANLILEIYALIFARVTFRNWNAWLVQLGFRGLGVLNHRTDFLSGERHLIHSRLRRFLGTDTPVIFDVGANDGNYTVELTKEFPKGKIFAFEPHPATCGRLQRRIADRAHVRHAALGSSVGKTILYDSGNGHGSGHASIYGQVLRSVHKIDNPTAVDVEMDTIDHFSEANGIDIIDFLKIDTEGNELEVLKGAARLLKAGRVRFIQFEFNEMNTVSRVFLADFFSILPNHTLFRLLPHDFLPIENVPLTREVFAFQNLLAVPDGQIERCGLPKLSWFSRPPSATDARSEWR
jgi:FkbM family methyltransferase